MNLPEIIKDMGDHTTHRDRPFTGQPHTDQGERGKTEVKGIRFRDLADCAARAFVDSCGIIGVKGQLLRQRVEDGTFNYNDLYDLPIEEIDPVAFIQNLCCRVEKEMGIFPNIKGKQ